MMPIALWMIVPDSRDKETTMRPHIRLLELAFFCGAAICAAGAQGQRARIADRTYADDRISVTAPATWSMAIDVVDGNQRGAILRKGKYILRLCTSCAQTSGIVGGRFAEISGLVQPWFRVDPGANPGPCGQQNSTRVSEQLSRIDFWFRRDPVHVYNQDADDCRQPETTATVWYGSYFEDNCSFADTGEDCGGYFLHLNWLTGSHPKTPGPIDEMAFGLTYDETNLDQLPHQGEAELDRVLIEATNIVHSVHFKPAGTAGP
jgi:hypothetical protein